MTLNELCDRAGKPYPIIRAIQGALGLPTPPQRDGYSHAYLCLVRKVISLRAFAVPLDDIAELLLKERRLLEVLHLDAPDKSPTWYLEQGDRRGKAHQRLLLTGFDVGFHLETGQVQAHLDFTPREGEMFSGHEMGEDARRALDSYLLLLERVQTCIARETPVLRDALRWARLAMNGRGRRA